MKIALCISGHVREYESLLEGLKQLKNKFNADVFIHSYKKRGTGVRFAFGTEAGDDFLSQQEIDLIEDKLSPVKSLFTEDLPSFPEMQGIFYKTQKMFLPEPHYKMIYKMWECNELKKQYEQENNFKYDLVIRSRFDLGFEQVDLSNFKKGKLFAARADMKQFMTDTFFACDSKSMDKIMEIKEHYGKTLLTKDFLNCENVFTHWASINNLDPLYGGISVKLRDKKFN